MPVYRAPVRDHVFVINELVKFDRYAAELGYEDVDADTIAAVFEEAGRLADEVFFPINQSGDEEGCTLKDHVVTVPSGFADAYKTYCEGGWAGLTADPNYGGQGMPQVLGVMVEEMFTAANHALFLNMHLTHSAAHAMHGWASQELKDIYLEKLISGEWTGTMNLTESHAGTDLGMIRTKAEPQADGSYKIDGTKIFITAGEHEMASNIVHLVLAKLPDAPAGTKGISLFVVPKFLPDDAGEPGERNSVYCQSIEHKMGIKGSGTCVLNYEGAKGWLIGSENNGLRAMFTMMNSARLAVGLEGSGKAEIAYQNGVAYATDRIQGRAATGPVNKDKAADPIIVHADVRRMLLTQRAFVEGARALAGEIALNLDITFKSQDQEARQKADDFVQLMTPIAKAFFTDEGFAAANATVQIFGGHGYISEHGVEQYVRDVRISQLYEGTNGIQSMDLAGRKLSINGGRAPKAFLEDAKALLAGEASDDAMAAFVEPMKAAVNSLQLATDWIMANRAENPQNTGAAAVDYCRLFGVVALGLQWVKMARVSLDTLAAGTDEADFYENKLIVGRYYMARSLTEHAGLLARIQSGAEPVMALAAEAF